MFDIFCLKMTSVLFIILHLIFLLLSQNVNNKTLIAQSVAFVASTMTLEKRRFKLIKAYYNTGVALR